MKKKFLLFIFAFLFLPGVFYFSGCGKETVKVNGFNVYIDDVIFSQNNKTIYLDYGDTDDWKDLIKVKKTFSNNTEEAISEKSGSNDGYTITVTPETQTLNADTYTVVISYGDFSSVTITMIVDRLSIAKPTAIIGLVYNGEAQTGVNYLADAGYTVTGDTSHAEAGDHTATFTLDTNHKWADGSTDPVVITWTIDKKKVFVPAVGQITYTGEKQTSTIVESTYYTVVDNGGIEVGEYEAVLTLKDKDNYYFDGDTTKENETTTVKYNIIQATNKFTGTLSMTGWTYKGEITTPDATELEAAFGDKADLVYTYHTDADATSDPITMSSTTDAGTYYIKATLAGTKNYTGVSTIVPFVIAKKNNSLISGITIEDYEYTGVAPSPIATAEFGEVSYRYFTDADCTTEIEEAEVLNVGTYYVKACVAESTNYNAFESEAKSFTISQATNAMTNEVEIDGWTYKDATISTPTATAKFGTVNFKYYDNEECEGQDIAMSSLTDAGTYYVKAYVEETANFTSASSVIDFVISKKNNMFTTELTISNWTYSSLPLAPSAEVEYGEIEYNYYADEECTEEVVIGEMTDAGTYYVVANVAESKNYNALTMTTPVSFKIEKAKNNFTRTIQENIEWEYSSTPVYPIASAKFGTVTFKYYSDAECNEEIANITANTNAGTYYAKAFVAETDNYMGLTSEVATININRKEIYNYPYIEQESIEYTGEKITAVIIGIDNSIIEVEGNEGTNAGDYTAIVTLNPNYKFSNSESNIVELDWIITKKTVAIPEINGINSYEYTGSEINPSILNYNAEYMDIAEESVTSATNISDEGYTITYKLKENYKWSNDDESEIVLTWFITKIKVSAPTGNNVCYTTDDEVEKIIDFDEDIFEVVDKIEDEGYITTNFAEANSGQTYNYIIKLKDSSTYELISESYAGINYINKGEDFYLIYKWTKFETVPFKSITLTTIDGTVDTLTWLELTTLTEVEYGSTLTIVANEGYLIREAEEFTHKFLNSDELFIDIQNLEGSSALSTNVYAIVEETSVIESVEIGENTYTWEEFIEITSIGYGETVKITTKDINDVLGITCLVNGEESFEFAIEEYDFYYSIQIHDENGNINLRHEFSSYIEPITSLKINDKEFIDEDYVSFDFGDTLTMTKNSSSVYDNCSVYLTYDSNEEEIKGEDGVYSVTLDKYSTSGAYHNFIDNYTIIIKDGEKYIESYNFNRNQPQFEVKINDETYSIDEVDNHRQIEFNSTIKPVLDDGYQIRYSTNDENTAGYIANDQEFVMNRSGTYRFMIVYKFIDDEKDIEIEIQRFEIDVLDLNLKFTVDGMDYGISYVEDHYLTKNQETVTINFDEDMYDSITESGSILSYGWSKTPIESNTLTLNLSELSDNYVYFYLNGEEVGKVKFVEYRTVLGVTYYGLAFDSIVENQAQIYDEKDYDDYGNVIEYTQIEFYLNNQFLKGFDVKLESDTMTFKLFDKDKEISVNDICLEAEQKTYTMKVYDKDVEIENCVLNFSYDFNFGSQIFEYRNGKYLLNTSSSSINLPSAGEIDQEKYPGYNGIELSIPKDFTINDKEYGIYRTTLTMATSYNGIDYSNTVELYVSYNDNLSDYIKQISIETGTNNFGEIEYTQLLNGFIYTQLDVLELLSLKYVEPRDQIMLAEGWTLIPETPAENPTQIPVEVKYLKDASTLCMVIKITNGTEIKTFYIPFRYTGEISSNINISEAFVTDYLTYYLDLTESINNSTGEIVVEANANRIFGLEAEEDATSFKIYFGSIKAENLIASANGYIEFLMNQAGKYYIVITSSDGTNDSKITIDFQADELLPYFSGWLTTDTNKDNAIIVELTKDGMGGNVMFEDYYGMPIYAFGYLGNAELEQDQKTIKISAVSYLDGICIFDGTEYKVVEDLSEVELAIQTNGGTIPGPVNEKYVVMYMQMAIDVDEYFYVPLYMYLCAPQAVYAFDVQYGEDHVYARAINEEIDTNCTVKDEFLQVYVGDLYNVDLSKPTINATVKSDLFKEGLFEIIYNPQAPSSNLIDTTDVYSFTIQEDTSGQVAAMTQRDGKFIMFAFMEDPESEMPVYVVIFLNEGPAPTQEPVDLVE